MNSYNHDREVITPKMKFAAAIIIFLAMITGYVIMAILAPDQDYRGIWLYGGLAATSLGISSQIDVVKRKVDTVERQTNGQLTAKIEEVAETAADKAIEKAVHNPAIGGASPSSPSG